MQVFRLAYLTDEGGRYYSGALESSRIAKEQSKSGKEVFVYRYNTPKVTIDQTSFLLALNEEQWCEPVLIAHFINGKAQKV